MAWGRLAVDSALEVEDDRWEATGAAARGTELLSGQTDELPARLPLAAALTAVGCIFAVSRPLMPYGALRPAITDPRRVGVSPDAAPRRRRHGTAPSIADHRAHPGSTTRFFLPFRLTETGRLPTSNSGIGEKRWPVRRWIGSLFFVLGSSYFVVRGYACKIHKPVI